LQYITRQAWFINTTAMRDAKFIQEQSQKAEVEALGRVQMQNKGNHKPMVQNEAVSFGGTLKRNSAGFGFVKDKIIGDVFIPQSIILNHQNGEAINGKAVKKFDKKKQQWGYAAIKIN
jgi:transcription termination factor Rho